VNLFAGIARSDVVAAGIVAAAAETAAEVPLVVSMRGTNAIKGIEILTDSGLDITVVTDLAGAADVLQQKLLDLERSN
jgi:succinyl-CoA synthetase beta subunit